MGQHLPGCPENKGREHHKKQQIFIDVCIYTHICAYHHINVWYSLIYSIILHIDIFFGTTLMAGFRTVDSGSTCGGAKAPGAFAWGCSPVSLAKEEPKTPPGRRRPCHHFPTGSGAIQRVLVQWGQWGVAKKMSLMPSWPLHARGQLAKGCLMLSFPKTYGSAGPTE